MLDLIRAINAEVALVKIDLAIQIAIARQKQSARIAQVNQAIAQMDQAT